MATSCGTGFGKLTRVTSGGNLPPSEVIMSRPLKKHMTKFTELLKGNLVDYAIEYRVHATRRMFQRHIGAEEVAFILTHGQVIERYDEDFPLPSVLLNGRTAANRPLHVVVGINVDERKLVIITTFEPDALQWADNFSRRIV